MLGFYNYTVILTYLGMLSGFVGITCAYSGNIWGALICIIDRRDPRAVLYHRHAVPVQRYCT